MGNKISFLLSFSPGAKLKEFVPLRLDSLTLGLSDESVQLNRNSGPCLIGMKIRCNCHVMYCPYMTLMLVETSNTSYDRLVQREPLQLGQASKR